MARQDIRAEIILSEESAPGIFRLTLHAPGIASDARAGQFCMLQPGDRGERAQSHDPLLRRPLSIHDCREGSITFLYRVMGRGTGILSKMQKGESVRVLGPLGNSFRFSREAIHIAVGGGMGIAPMLFLARRMAEDGILEDDKSVSMILGAATSAELCSIPEMENILPSGSLLIATEDGSMGHEGLVTDLLKESLHEAARVGKEINIMTCGPFPMMKAVVEMASHFHAHCQVSLEAHMACGSGLCLGCAVPSTNDGYVHVCREGPIFDAGLIAW